MCIVYLGKVNILLFDKKKLNNIVTTTLKGTVQKNADVYESVLKHEQEWFMVCE